MPSEAGARHAVVRIWDLSTGKLTHGAEQIQNIFKEYYENLYFNQTPVKDSPSPSLGTIQNEVH